MLLRPLQDVYIYINACLRESAAIQSNSWGQYLVDGNPEMQERNGVWLALLCNLPVPVDVGERDSSIAVKSKYATSVEARHIVGELRLCEEEIRACKGSESSSKGGGFIVDHLHTCKDREFCGFMSHAD